MRARYVGLQKQKTLRTENSSGGQIEIDRNTLKDYTPGCDRARHRNLNHKWASQFH